jgi:hypothetical protein
MIKHLESILSEKGYVLESSYRLFLKSDYSYVLKHMVFFEKENLNFAFSFISIKWSDIKSEIELFGIYPEYTIDFISSLGINIDDDKLVINDLYTMEEMKKNIADFVKYDKSFLDGFLQIGYMNSPINSRLMYSLNKKNLGSIWLEMPDENFLIKIANNLVELLEKSSLEIREANINRFGYKLSQLYRNWNEDFWRVREENS